MKLLLFLLLLLHSFYVAGQNFKIVIDTVEVDIKGNPRTALKYKNLYYCFFETDNPLSTKSFEHFYVFGKTGQIVSRSEVSGDLDTYYKDLHVRNDSIIVKTYYGDNPTFYYDEKNSKWALIKTVDDLIYEDDQYYITSLDFGEWGGGTWFKDQKSNKEYYVAVAARHVYILNNTYYLTSGLYVIAIDDPKNLVPVQNKYTYKSIVENGFMDLYNDQEMHSMKGAEFLYQQNEYDWYSEQNFYIGTTFIVSNALFHILVDKNRTYIARLKDGKFEHVTNVAENIQLYSSAYRNSGYNEAVQFFNKVNKSYGFLEIEGNTITLIYIKQQ